MAKSSRIPPEAELILKQLAKKKSEERVPHSPQKGEKALNISDLEPFPIQNRDKSETDILSDKSLYHVLQELSERKKMYFFNPIPYLEYRCCKLTEGKEWYISYYVQDPSSKKLKRVKLKLNRINPIKERRKAARSIMAAIDQKLSLGWNPLMEAKAPKAFSHLFETLDLFLRIKAKETEANTMRSYQSFIKTFKSWLEQHSFNKDSFTSSITKEVAIAFMDDMEEDISAKTYNNYIAFYRSLFAWMMEKGYIEINPFEEISKKAKRLTKKSRRLLSDEELALLINYLQKENPEYLAMAMICYCCFIRPKEISLLKCRDINLAKQLIHIKAEIAKNDNDSYRTIPDDLVPILRSLDLSHPDWYLFGQHEGSGDFSPSEKQVCSRKIAKWWDQHVRPDCGFGPDLQFYSLKDTGITNMLGDGVPINLVQQQADHSSVAMTAIYVGHMPKATEELKESSILRVK